MEDLRNTYTILVEITEELKTLRKPGLHKRKYEMDLLEIG
jgi:hypothetical protein